MNRAAGTGQVSQRAVHPGLITLSVMLAAIMQAVDSTIAAVALPKMQGAMGATQNQIAWVLTSSIVAAAIFMPLTGFLAARLGRRRVFMWAVVGFTLASMLSGAAQSLSQLVSCRILQGVFGAFLIPLSQAVLLDSHPRERHASAMALWGVGVMVGPILGPSLGGWLTEHMSWRWVFYINVPLGILTWLGLAAFVQETPVDRARRFDGLGFGLLALAIGAFQMTLDRGESLGWFASAEIVAMALLAGLALYLFLAHMFTHAHPLIEPGLFRDRNFSVGLLLIFLMGFTLFGTMALLPPFLHKLLGYPVLDVGNLLVPRGIGTMMAMFAAGRLAGLIDLRWQILLGMALTSLAMYEMTLFNADIGAWHIVRTGIVQGLGVGFVFVSLATVAFSTLSPRFRNDGAALFSLTRNIGASIGISAMVTLLAHNAQAGHTALAESINPFSLALRQAVEAGVHDLSTAQGLLAMEAEVGRQAAMLAYLQDFRLMMWIALAGIPLIALLRKPRSTAPMAEPPAVAE
ncbi:MAG: DHA2 family efflux MFS transporter permease subunit [Burkholderiaceae bacterium]|nr:DHA2 family efflux MFS transporter permease subunit [Burkholderiaceae bacterium]